jgi:hypothetical protein
VKIAYKNILNKSMGDNKIKELITHCKNMKWLCQDDKGKYILGSYISTNIESDTPF